MLRRGARPAGAAPRRWRAAGAVALAFAAALAAAALLPAPAGGALRARAGGARSAARALAAALPAISADALQQGELLTWGVGGPQRLGRHGDTALPLPVGHGLEAVRFVALAAGGHTLGVSSEGDVWVWGRNSSDGGGGHGSAPVPDAGQLGHAVEGRPGAALRAADAGAPATSVAAGRYHSAAAAAGKAWTWGLNDQGQLGRGATNAPHTGEEPCFAGATCRSGVAAPVSGGGLEAERVVAVAAGRYSTLAITASGALFTWGLDGCAEGAPPAPAARHVPRRVRGGGLGETRVVAVSVGYVHWAALTADGEVFTCNTGDDGYAATLTTPRGGNADGELGRAGPPHVPGRVGGALAGERVVSVAAGRAHTLAATSSGAVLSWGNNQARQLGRDTGGATPAAQPARVAAVAGPASAVAAGEYFSLAALADGGLLGWGANGNGQLGRGAAAAEEEGGKGALDVGPAAGGAAPSRRVVALAAGYQHAAAIVVDATADKPAAGGASGSAPDAAAGPSSENGGWTVVPAEGPVPAFPPRRTPAEAWAAHTPSARRAAVEASSPDVFSALPPPRGLLPGLASPCWRADDVITAGGAPPPVLCLPAVHVLGVSKCGTTDLYRRLSRHPDFVQSTNKGPHFWDESVSASSGFEQYVQLFDPLAQRVGTAPPAAAAPLVSADASSNTFTAAGVWRRGHEPQGDVTIGELLFEAAPYTRCVVMLREPGARMLSAFHYYRKLFGPPGQATAHDFHEHVTQSIATFERCAKDNGGDTWPCIKRFEPQQLIKGLYAEFLWDWAPRFPREQLLMLRLEDYSGDMRRHLSAVFAFVGLREPTEAEWGAILEAPRANTRADRGLLAHGGDMMLPETREALSAFYAPFNEALAKALGDDRFAWRDAA